LTDDSNQRQPTISEIFAINRKPVRRVFLLLLVLAVVSVAMIFFIDPREYPVGGMCGLKQATGLDCCGCGATRATHLMLHGRFIEAFRYNPLWAIGWPLLVYVAASLVLDFGYGRRLPGRLHVRRWFWITLAVVLVLYSVARNLPWHPFTLLASP